MLLLAPSISNQSFLTTISKSTLSFPYRLLKRPLLAYVHHASLLCHCSGLPLHYRAGAVYRADLPASTRLFDTGRSGWTWQPLEKR
jgi:hypothetical protein